LCFWSNKISRLSINPIFQLTFKKLHLILELAFFLTDNRTIEVITINNSSSEECSMSDVEVYLISSKVVD
ncbi:hypothetical protein, partial [Sulfurimonas sp.]|uniref:hypothetical protein n=1 Tax=Sulfurimonas sp. TaxID=2022749 RepID=UPI0025E8584C